MNSNPGDKFIVGIHNTNILVIIDYLRSGILDDIIINTCALYNIAQVVSW